MQHLVILGAGTAGTMMANRMAERLPRDRWTVTVVDKDDVHVYQPGLLFLPFRQYRVEEILKPRASLLSPRCELVLDAIDRVDPAEQVVALASGRRLPYDVLVVATGSHIRPEQTPGMTGRLWQKDVFDFYTLDGATKLAGRLDAFEGGRVIVDTLEMPIKCPVAPLEFTFLADAYFRERGIRDKVELVYATPLDGAFTKPVAAAAFGSMLEERGISVVTNFAANRVDEERRLLRSYDGREEPFDLLVTIPLHGGAEAIVKSGLGDDFGFVPTDKHTLQSKAHPNVFVIGDATDVPASKAGSVAHFEGDVLTENLLRFIEGRGLEPSFDGHANCFIETGRGKAMLIDFNYETEPLPGRFPLPGLGPFTLLEESEVNHWGKLAFKWVYWNVLVKGGELPLDHRMLMAGKRS
ncbi:MAG: NAD(P)/FAD-dependent oxidoreductase [Sandaracinaceae bacterium]|nr:NAD(P)/FAD-dependent oxidoreductase [Sandaracinaceae bacterium]